MALIARPTRAFTKTAGNNVQFAKGNQLAKKRRKRAGGRPTKEQLEDRRLQAELAKKWLEDRLKRALEVYYGLATGENEPGSKRRKKPKLDPQTCRHFIERFVPPATKKIEIQDNRTAEWFYEQVEKEMEEESHQAALPEPDPEKDPSLS